MFKDITEFNDYIEESNTSFNESSDDIKRVMIAQDVLERIRLQQFRPYGGTVCTITMEAYNSMKISSFDSARETMLRPDFRCNVCAKGAMLMSYVGRVNRLTVADTMCNYRHNNAAFQQLREIFSEYQLALIEAAFEGNLYVCRDVNGESLFNTEKRRHELNSALSLYSPNKNPDTGVVYYRQPNEYIKIMTDICENIIRNVGTYIPSQDLTA